MFDVTWECKHCGKIHQRKMKRDDLLPGSGDDVHPFNVTINLNCKECGGWTVFSQKRTAADVSFVEKNGDNCAFKVEWGKYHDDRASSECVCLLRVWKNDDRG